MIDELLCMTMKEGKKVFSIEKCLARVTYLALGFGAALGTKAIVSRM